jgi:hypothetical protein
MILRPFPLLSTDIILYIALFFYVQNIITYCINYNFVKSGDRVGLGILPLFV